MIAPLKRTRPVDEVRAAAQTLADQVAAEHPDTLTTAWRKDKRDGRILVDVARNTYGQTIVAPYAVRALPGAPISAPVSWDEVEDPALGPQKFKLREFAARLSERGDPWADIDEHAAALPKDSPLGRLGAWGSSTKRRRSPSRRRPSWTRSEPGFLVCARRRAGHRLRPARPADPAREDGIAAARRSDRGDAGRAAHRTALWPARADRGAGEAAGHAGGAVGPGGGPQPPELRAAEAHGR